ncbi:hypothetical protein ElyMa_006169300 [Elysia marginata]|uniref:Uncharacterized protein n=1 Tax=Elysia marginata TaxID=1093978 RepID=A0AAV4H0K9_9GAST|nr:hypothetical protein ElyMa_006169300 [Elysia marginata]
MDRISRLIFVLASTDSAKAIKTLKSLQHPYDHHDPADHDVSLQESLSQDSQTVQNDRRSLAPNNFLSLQDRYAWNDKANKADDYRGDDYRTKSRYVSGVLYSYYTTRAPKIRGNLNRRRRKRQRIKNKSRSAQLLEKSSPSKKTRVRHLDAASATNGFRGPPGGKSSYRSDLQTDDFHSKRDRTSISLSPTVSRKKYSFESSSTSETVDNSKKDKSSLSRAHLSYDDGSSNKSKHHDILPKDPLLPKITLSSLRPENPKAFKHDPFLNAPADRYDLRPAKERVVLETTTAMPKFGHSGSRKAIPDPFFLPGPTKVVAHEGGVAILPCGVKYLEMKEVRH